MRILVVDDEVSTQFLLTSTLGSWGHQTATAGNGKEAWDLLNQEQFDLIISDWSMPELDGLELCRLIRSSVSPSYRYVILCTGYDRKADFLRGMEAGADDFLVKPIGAGDLRARLRAAERILALQAESGRQNSHLRKLNEQLGTAYETIRRDLQAAAAMQIRLLPKKADLCNEAHLEWLLIPSSFLAGDMLNYFMADDRKLVFYQLDVSGHGIPAALLSVTLSCLLTPEPVSPVFQSLSDVGTERRIAPPATVVSELNRRFQQYEDEYFTIVYGIFDTKTGELTFCQAGHPMPLYQGADGLPLPVGAGGFPVGMWPQMDYEETSITLAPGDRLFVYSDGITECRNPTGEPYSRQRLEEVLKKSRDSSLAELVQAVEGEVSQWHGSSEFADDVSLLVLERKL